jgi:DNA primase
LLSREEFSDYCKRYRLAWRYLNHCAKDRSKTVREICTLRGYQVDRMSDILLDVGFIYVDNSKLDLKILKSYGDDLSLLKDGKFLLDGRYIFPVMDMLGNIIALIGWYPDERKYVTTPSKMFNKSCLFYGMEQLSKSKIGSSVILVEGIFDSISLRSLGYNSLAMMGIESSRYKEILYTLFKNILAIPDNDKQGRLVVSNDKWKLPLSGKYMTWNCKTYIKDIDSFINLFQYDDVKNLINDVLKENKRIVNVELGV